MQIIVKNKFFSWGGSSKVEDEAGKSLYQVRGAFFSWTRRKKILDLEGNLLYKVRNKWPTFLLHSALVFDANGNKICKIRQTLRMNRIFLVEDCAQDIQIMGAPLLGMSVVVNGETIGSITKKFWSLRDYFVLDVPDGQDPTFLIAMTIAIDNIHDKARGQSR